MSTNTAAAAAKTATRKPRAPSLTLPQKLAVLDLLRKAESAAVPDADMAARAAEQIDRPVLATTIGQYREQLGLASVPKPTARQLAVYVEVLKAALERLGEDVPPMPAADDEKQAALPL